LNIKTSKIKKAKPMKHAGAETCVPTGDAYEIDTSVPENHSDEKSF
jgi:hypothetical protein